MSKFVYPYENFFIIDIGRGSERSAIQIENGEFKGYGYFEPSYIIHPEELKNLIQFPKEKVDHKKLSKTIYAKNSKHLDLIAY